MLHFSARRLPPLVLFLSMALAGTLAGAAEPDEHTEINVEETAAPAAVTLPEVTVEASGQTSPTTDGYSATKTDTPLIETPMSVQIVPREVMDAQQVTSIKDAVRNISGVQSNDYNYYDFIQLRGFQNGYAANYHNGLQLQAITGLEPALLERIEVVKGPASMLYGRIEPGGLVNLVYKRAEPVFAASAQQQAGSFGKRRTVVDVTNKLSEDGQLAGRFVGAYSQADSFIDFVESRNIVGAGFLNWTPSDRFTLNLRYENQHNRFVDTDDIGIPFIDGRPVKVPRKRFFGDVASVAEFNEPKRNLLGFDWTLDLDEHWRLTQRFHWDTRREQQMTIWANDFDGVSQIDRGQWFIHNTRDTYATNLDLTGDFNLGGVRHRALVGIDWFRFTADWDGFSGTHPSLPPIDVFNPVYGVYTAADLRALPKNSFFSDHDSWRGVYAQDQISLGEHWELLVGGRYDWAKYGSGFSDTSLALARTDLSPERDKDFSPRVGLLYKLNPATSLYASYSQSFGSNNGRSATGDAFDPETGRQYEIGAKYTTADGFTASAALFDLVKNNILTDDPNNPDPSFKIAIGEARNRGLEFDVAGRLTPNWNVIASYTFSDTEVTKDNGGFLGKEIPNVPRHSASLWADYDAAHGREGWIAGAGLYLVGRRQADRANTGILHGYGRVDAMLGYRFLIDGTLALAQLNVNNIFDKDYYDRSDAGYAKYGEPRAAMFSLRLDF